MAYLDQFVQECKDQHNVSILLRGGHDVKVVGLYVGKGVFARLDDRRDEACKGMDRIEIDKSYLWRTRWRIFFPPINHTFFLALHQQGHKLIDHGQVHVAAVVARDQDLSLHVQHENG